MVLNEQKQENIKADIDDKRSLKERLREQTEGLKKAGKVTGQTIVESMPIIGETIGVKNIARDIKDKDYVGAGIETAALGAGLFPVVGDVAAKGLRSFNKTRKAYKLFVQREDGGLYPLFVDADKRIPQKIFTEANFPKEAFKADNEKFYVPSRGAKREGRTEYYDPDGKKITKAQYDELEDSAKKQIKVKKIKAEKTKGTGDQVIIPNAATRKKLIKAGYSVSKPVKGAKHGKVLAVAARPGYHASQFPVATHIGPEDLVISKKEVDTLLKAGITPEAIKSKTFYYNKQGKLIGKKERQKLSADEIKKLKQQKKYYVKRRAEDHVYAEVDMAADVDYDKILKDAGKTDINDKVPVGGSYKYVDGQADSDFWVVGGNMRVNRVLSRDEVRDIQNKAKDGQGVKDLPYKGEVEKILGREFAKGGVVKGDIMEQGIDDYMIAKTEPQDVEMNKGGVAKQMDMFQEGGLEQDGGTVDPVSGNDVPVGSSQAEVRDDIPARLSEGEFVFPADVVRFLGLEFLMQLRQRAKAGLQKMSDMGQMGNSDEATIPDDVPFTIDDLEMEDETKEMFIGGAIPSGGPGIPPATTMPFTDYSPVMPSNGGRLNLNPNQLGRLFGGQPQQSLPTTNVVSYTPQIGQDQIAQQYGQQNQNLYTIGQPQAISPLPTFTDIGGQQGTDFSNIEYKTFTNPDTGEQLVYPFLDGQILPGYSIAEGFVEQAEAVAQTPDTTPTTTKVTEDVSRRDEGEQKQPDEGFGAGAGRIVLGGESDPNNPGFLKSGTFDTFGVSFTNPKGFGVLGTAQIMQGIATGKFPEGTTVTLTKNNFSQTVDAKDYAEIKENPKGEKAQEIIERQREVEKSRKKERERVAKVAEEKRQKQREARKRADALKEQAEKEGKSIAEIARREEGEDKTPEDLDPESDKKEQLSATDPYTGSQYGEFGMKRGGLASKR